MLSDLSFSTLLSDPSIFNADEDPHVPLNFDDLLDIAREFEFTRTITHIWPCEEEPNTGAETRLEDILAAIVPTPTVKDSPVPLPSSAPVNPAHAEEVDSPRLATACPAPDARFISIDPVLLPKVGDQARVETKPPATSTLRGWSPPSGSQFLDLDDKFMVPEPAKVTWSSPWLSMSLIPSSTGSVGSMSETTSAISGVHPQTSATVPKPPPTGASDELAQGSGKKSVALPVQPLTRACLEPVLVLPAAQTNSSAPSQMVTTPYTKIPKSRQHLRAMVNAVHTRAPRGGIPPHIARSVTKANILRVEKERKMMQDAFSDTATTEAKKPSVLRGSTKAGKETGRTDENNQKGRRLVRRTRV